MDAAQMIFKIRTSLKEPVFVLLAALFALFISGFILLIGLNFYFNSKIEELDQMNINERARLNLAEKINLRLSRIEANVYRMATSIGDRRQDLFYDHLQTNIADIRKIVGVLENGGTYQISRATNLVQEHDISETLSYVRPQESSRFILEGIDLLPKLKNLEEKIHFLKSIIVKRDQAQTSNEHDSYYVAISRVKGLLKKFPPIITRMHENTNRIYVESLREYNFIQATLKDKRDNYVRLEFYIATLTIALLIMIGGLLVMRITRMNLHLKNQHEKMKDLKNEAIETERQNSAIKSILELSFADNSLEEMLDKAMKALVSVSWLKVESQGSFFLAEPENRKLRLVADYNLADPLKTKCAKVNYGTCLCGRAAERGEIIFAKHIDDRHDISFEGIKPHGHICLPIKSNKELLGVLNLYLADGCERSKIDEDFLMMACRAFASMIVRKRSEEMLSKLSHALEQSPASVIITNLDGVIEYVNPTFCNKTGYAPKEVIGQPTSMLRSENMTEMSYQQLWDRIKSGKVWRGEFLSHTKDHFHFWESAAISPIRDHHGNITHYMAIKEDISRSKKNEKDLRHAKEEAEKANIVKSDFLATMSHEIRTPMNGVIGMTDLLSDTNLDEQQRHYCETIKSSSAALLNIINDILDYSKIEAGKLKLHNEEFDLQDLVLGVMELLNVKAEEKQIELAYFIEPQANGWFKGDAGRLRQVLLNLIGNAIKFTETGGVALWINVFDNGMLRFEVRDTGIGISKEDARKLFESFSQVDASVARKHGGTGLGLSISKQIIHLFGGQIGVKSIFGTGSIFWFEIPNNKLDKIINLPDTSQKVGPVLLVDECDLTAETLLKVFNTFHIPCERVVTAERGMEKLKKGADFKTLLLTEKEEKKLDHLVHGDADLSKRLQSIKTLILSNTHQSIKVDNRIRLSKPFTLKEFMRQINPQKALDAIASPFQESDHNQAKEIQPLKLLVAEDNKINQMVIQGILSKMGHSVDLAENGQQAIDAVLQSSYDLVLMDVQMPVMDGLSATYEIRRMPPPKGNVTIIAITANAMPGDVEKCILAGMNSYLSKPIKKEELSDILHQSASKKIV